jgi:hypothetical protein
MGDFHLISMKIMRNPFLLFCLLLFSAHLQSQTLGGSAIYSFLNLSPAPQLSAAGGINVSILSKDPTLGWHNPALLRPGMHRQLSTNFTSMYAGIRSGQAMGIWHQDEWNSTMSVGVQYMDYGTTVQTDASGNILGNFRPNEYALQGSVSRSYLERWQYGGTVKFIHSSYGSWRSSGLALDVGLNYFDSTGGWQVGFVARNMGFQLQTFGSAGEDLPFDLQLGVTRRIPRSPFQFSLTAHRLHRFDLIHEDTVFNAAEGINRKQDTWLNNLFRHFVFAAQLLPSERLEFTIGYNVLRRTELGLSNQTNGLTGFSFGAGVLLRKMQIRFSRTQYQSNTGFSQFGLNLQL